MKDNDIIAVLSEIVDRLFEKNEDGEHEVTLDDIESRTELAARKIKEVMLQGWLDKIGDGYAGSKLPCKCGGKLKFIGHRKRTLRTWCGDITIDRAYYYCKRCRASRIPLDDELKIPKGQFSERIVEAISYCCAELPFESASSIMERLSRISVSPKEAQLLSERIGAEIGEELKAQAEIAITDGLSSDSKPERLYITIDGVMVHEEDGWHETKVSAIYDVITQVGPKDHTEDIANQITYVAQRAAPEEFGAHVSKEAQIRGEASAKEVIFIADGATWIWNLAETYFPQAIQIIDWYHVSEHIWKFARILYDDNEEQCKAWVDEQLRLLNDGLVKEIVNMLRAMTGLRDDAILECANLARYLESNQERMKYDEYRAKGYHVGSGVVESACKNVVQVRHKRPGMRWSEEGARNILHLRTTLLNKRWDEFWKRRKANFGGCNQGKASKAA